MQAEQPSSSGRTYGLEGIKQLVDDFENYDMDPKKFASLREVGLRVFVGELLATFLLMFPIFVATEIFSENYMAAGGAMYITVFGNALVILLISVPVLTWGVCEGIAIIDPIVVIQLLRLGALYPKEKFKALIIYFSAEIIGTLLACGIGAIFVYDIPNQNFGAPFVAHNVSLGKAFGVEAIGSGCIQLFVSLFFLVPRLSNIGAIAAKKMKKTGASLEKVIKTPRFFHKLSSAQSFPLSLAIAGYSILALPFTGASFNWWRFLVPRLYSNSWQSYDWIYIVGPLLISIPVHILVWLYCKYWPWKAFRIYAARKTPTFS